MARQYTDSSSGITYNRCGFHTTLTTGEQEHRNFSRAAKIIEIFSYFNNAPVDTEAMKLVYRLIGSDPRHGEETVANDTHQCHSFMSAWNKMALELKLGHAPGKDGCTIPGNKYHRICQKKHPTRRGRARVYWVDNAVDVFRDRPVTSIASSHPSGCVENPGEHVEPLVVVKNVRKRKRTKSKDVSSKRKIVEAPVWRGNEEPERRNEMDMEDLEMETKREWDAELSWEEDDFDEDVFEEEFDASTDRALPPEVEAICNRIEADLWPLTIRRPLLTYKGPDEISNPDGDDVLDFSDFLADE